MSVSYWRQRDRYYRIIGSRCNDCSKLFFPYVRNCKSCNSANIVDEEMSKTGKLLSYTYLFETTNEFSHQIPILFGLIELENGVRLISQITDYQDRDVKIGKNVKAVFRKIREDDKSSQIHYGYKFIISD
jgi:uncharacterized OB-fold protein|tara:strand:+ start:618 stop:1007 length:390 start_codon:yes stop_codon:yes gene_type:complete